MRAKHRCPGCRAVEVPNTKLACYACWGELPGPVQREVQATAFYQISHPRRAAALKAAVDVWHPPVSDS